MRFYFIFIILISISCFNRNLNVPLKVIAAPLLTDTIVTRVNNREFISRFDYFIVQGFYDSSKKSVIEDYVINYSKELTQKYHHYEMIFFSESKNISLKKIQETPANLRWKVTIYEKPISSYLWIDGKFAP